MPEGPPTERPAADDRHETPAAGETVDDAAARVAAEVDGSEPARPARTGPDGEPLGGDAS